MNGFEGARSTRMMELWSDRFRAQNSINSNAAFASARGESLDEIGSPDVLVFKRFAL